MKLPVHTVLLASLSLIGASLSSTTIASANANGAPRPHYTASQKAQNTNTINQMKSSSHSTSTNTSYTTSTSNNNVSNNNVNVSNNINNDNNDYSSADEATGNSSSVSSNNENVSSDNGSSDTTYNHTSDNSTADTSNSSSTNSSSSTTSTSNSSVVNAALALTSQNIPYVWGGSSLSGMDCSGMVAYVYQQAAGVSLAHYTVAQESQVSYESVSDAQPGDILFWGDKGSTYHEGIYIGNGQYVAAATPGTNVAVYSISSYFMPSFAGHVN
ncbi:C40 family peptidase [Levilactobacillus bambusae]|uniref:NlpC/P60 domain-containing protein n=1 Tax=Levilactobacillus bambusae TaxID=2024736 RepID=A0A2V1MZN0_9LACO|nr:C40 family peptidase [Levilactobacillus bambusae]PWG00437.1 hypothetical protein DCM90_05800 [Levilactobacillus bambusae]